MLIARPARQATRPERRSLADAHQVNGAFLVLSCSLSLDDRVVNRHVARGDSRAYFPRVRRPKSERLYSDRRPSDSFLLAFLIDLPLACGCGSGTDDPDCIATLGVGDHEKAAACRDTEGDKSLFVAARSAPPGR